MTMTIIICDRCGKTITNSGILDITSNSLYEFHIDKNKGINKETFHICQNCMIKFKDWMSEYCFTEEVTND